MYFDVFFLSWNFLTMGLNEFTEQM